MWLAMLTSRKLKLLARYFASECSEKEKRSVESWIAASEENHSTGEELNKVWNLAAHKTESWSYRRSITGLRLKLKEIEPSPGGQSRGKAQLYRLIARPRRPPALTMPFIAQLAASLLLFAVVAYLVVYVKALALNAKPSVPKRTIAFHELSTEPGQQATLRFPDGTEVYLNSASDLRYADYPDGSRQLFLRGQAFFEVIHSAYHPFIVHTDYATIRDIGTRFDVRTRPGDKSTRVVVVRGKVIVHPNDMPSNDNALVGSGELTSVSSKGILLSPRYVDVNRLIAWTKGELVFHDDPVAHVIKQLERRYNIKCIVTNKSILKETLTATFNAKESTKEVLDIIALSLKLRYETSEDSVLFVPSGEKL